MDIKIKDNSKLRLVLFTQLEYIESTGTQYIDTGINPANANLTFKIGISNLEESSSFGCGEYGRGQSSCNIFFIQNDIRINWGAWEDYGHIIGSYQLNTLYEFIIKSGTKVQLNGVQTNYTAKTPSFSNNRSCTLKVGAMEYYNSSYQKIIYPISVRTHYFIVENDGIEILHLIPCITDFGTPGMYDIVSQTFFYNQGAGDFIAGPVSKYGLPGNKTTTLYHKNTPNVNGIQLLNSIFNIQETAEDVVLNRIRVDIGNVSGSLPELMRYSTFAGFNDNYEPQAKPRLVGTYTINDWYTQEQLTAAQAAFDGLTIIPDQNYLIDFNELAVQVLDDTQPNYNPAMSIILQAAGYGNVMQEPPIQGQTGRWFINKSEAANITTDLSSIFSDKQTSITDTNNIVNYNNLQYDLISLNELKYFIGITSFDYIGRRCSHLESIEFPNSVISLGTTSSIQGVLAENRTGTLKHVVFPTNLTTIKNFVLTNSKYIDDTNSPLEIPENVTIIGYGSFSIDFGGIIYGIHFNSTTPPTISSASLKGNISKIYVGDGSSAEHDNAILQAYLADAEWSTRASSLHTWYSYLHPSA